MLIIKKTSPNFTVGREGAKPDKIIIHWIGMGDENSTVTWFANPNSKVSAHYLVADDRVYQFVDEKDTAWQAGNWEVNTQSIGIEHEATPTYPMTESSYKTSGQLVKEIATRWNIPLDREHIKKHSEIVATSCPGTIDIDKIISIAKGIPSDLDKLVAELSATKTELNLLQVKYKELQDKYTKDMAQSQLQIETLQKTSAEMTAQLNLARQAVESAKKTSEALESKLGPLETRIGELIDENEQLEVNLSKMAEIANERDLKISELNKKLKEGLSGYSRWQLFIELFRR